MHDGTGTGAAGSGGHGAHVGKSSTGGPDVRMIQRALDLLGGDGGGKEDVEQRRKQSTKWKPYSLPAS